MADGIGAPSAWPAIPVLRWPCLVATPIRIMSDVCAERPHVYDIAPAMAPATGLEGEAVMLAAPRARGLPSVAVVGEEGTIRAMARVAGVPLLHVAAIDGHGRMVPASRERGGRRR